MSVHPCSGMLPSDSTKSPARTPALSAGVPGITALTETTWCLPTLRTNPRGSEQSPRRTQSNRWNFRRRIRLEASLPEGIVSLTHLSLG